MDEWIPLRPRTWPWRYGRLKHDVMMRRFLGWQNGRPRFCPHLVLAGTRVKITMVSMTGRIGITDDLTRQSMGYCAQVSLDDLIRDDFSQTENRPRTFSRP